MQNSVLENNSFSPAPNLRFFATPPGSYERDGEGKPRNTDERAAQGWALNYRKSTAGAGPAARPGATAAPSPPDEPPDPQRAARSRRERPEGGSGQTAQPPRPTGHRPAPAGPHSPPHPQPRASAPRPPLGPPRRRLTAPRRRAQRRYPLRAPPSPSPQLRSGRRNAPCRPGRPAPSPLGLAYSQSQRAGATAS